MSQRISLTRIVALGWYGFRQIFDLEDNALLSGAFGTGKSALLDLMQYVLLCDHWKANRAAAGNGRGRDLVGYCLGDTNQGQDQRHFLRRSGATIIALEFSRPPERGKEPRRETWGIRIEFSSPDASPKQTYFCIPTRLEYSSIAPDGKHLLPDDEFRAWIRREFGNDFLFSLQREYLAEMAAPRHLNFDSKAFLRTFPKAIAFEPEENIEKFIRDFILEESPLNVSDVQTAVRAYDDIRKRLERQEDEADFLRRISEQNTVYQASCRTEATLSHIFNLLLLLQCQERLERNRAELKRLEDTNAEDIRALKKATEESKRVNGLLADVRFQIHKDPAQIQFDELDRKARELDEKVAQLRTAQQSIQKQLDDRHYRWLQWLKHGASLPLEGLEKALAVDDADLLKLRTGAEADRLTAMQRLSARFNEIRNNVRDLLQPLKAETEANQKRLRQLAEDLENLSKGQAPGAFPLFTALRQKLGSRVEQLSRLIEVRPEAERWWPALELFLGRHRWVLVVNDADYREALDILKKTSPGREAESLLNPAEARQLRADARENSLFTKVQVMNPIGRLYVGHLLGQVQCVENITELEHTDAARAITPEGIFKQAPLRRRLKPAASVELTLGKEGLERMRSAKLREQDEVRDAFNSTKRRIDDVNSWLDNGQAGGLADAVLPERSAELSQLPALVSELRTARETILLLKTPEREAKQKQLRELEAQLSQLTKEIGAREKATQEFELKARPFRESVDRGVNEIRDLEIKAQEGRVQLSTHFSGILDSTLQSECDHFRQRFPKWNDCFAEVQREKAEAGRRADAARVARNSEREKLSTSRDARGNLRHPEYQHDFPVNEDSNELWDSRLKALEKIELKRSRQLAADCKKEWERRLQENVLNELNARITKAQNEIRLLDRYLSQPIGRFRYRIKPRRDTAGYAMIWKLLDGGFEATDPLLTAVPESESQGAKEELMRAVDSADSPDERSRRLLDYRNYHHYDIEMVPSDNPEAPPISLARSGRNLSGGENQAPFFISMLAAFRRVYDRGDRTSTRSQQLGLVVMDEAFSKLSGDGIEDCLALARSFQLQLIMAFPPERLGVMVPHAQTVVMCQKEVERDSRGYVTNITNYPLIVTMADAMEALS